MALTIKSKFNLGDEVQTPNGIKKIEAIIYRMDKKYSGDRHATPDTPALFYDCGNWEYHENQLKEITEKPK